jgi:signal transduction histidine kinase
VRAITADADNVVWVATAGKGLLRIAGDSFRWIEAKDGLYTNDAAVILEDAHGYFWISTQLGIYRVRRQELNAFAQGRIDRVSSTFFGKSDGLSDANCTGHGQPHGFVAKDGKLWFPTQDGLARIDPKTLPFNSSPPRMQIESCSFEQRATPCGEQVSLPPDVKDFEIKYTALNLIKSDQIKFRYRLEGLDKTWVNAGNRRTAYYSHLAPGTYKFSVTGANSDGVWNPSGKELAITVQPHYYQSIWFRSLTAGLTIGVFLLAWRLRAIQYRKGQALQRAFAQQIIASQETERKRIAGELHDSLGQRLAVIKNMALLLNRSADRNHHEQIDAIAAEASQAIGEVRQISYNLRPYQLDLLGLTKAVEVLAARTCEAAGIRADIVADDLAGVFQKEAEIHFYRIVQECLSNIVKHSNATLTTVLIQRTAGAVSLVVSDNGAGFVPEEQPGGGFGLTGISERAQLLGGKAAIQSSPGQGTTVTIEISSTR